MNGGAAHTATWKVVQSFWNCEIGLAGVASIATEPEVRGIHISDVRAIRVLLL